MSFSFPFGVSGRDPGGPALAGCTSASWWLPWRSAS